MTFIMPILIAFLVYFLILNVFTYLNLRILSKIPLTKDPEYRIMLSAMTMPDEKIEGSLRNEL